MSDNLRRYRAIRDAFTQWYPGQPTGTVARHLTTLAALISESREMLGIMDQLRYNGLDHSPATQTRRSSRMRVKLQLVICSDEGHEETVTDVMTLNKNSQRIEHLGLTLAGAKELLSTLQRQLLQHGRVPVSCG